MQPDEETGSAEEQPASNMAAPKLETVEYRSRSIRGGFNFTRMAIPLRKPLPSVREQCLVHGYVWQCPVEGFMVHCHAAHKSQHRFFIGHCCPHARHPAEVPVQALDPVGGIYHRLYLGSVVEICHVRLVVRAVAKKFDSPVILAPFITHLLPFCPCRFNRIVTLACAENVTQIGCQGGLIPVPDFGKHIAFQVGYTAL